jgi:ribosomal protein S18 acetylase RimI-like enzyme
MEPFERKVMTDSINAKAKKTSVRVELVDESLLQRDLDDLCDATDAAIADGGGFGWLTVPERPMLERYWQGVIAAPTRLLFVARLDGTICGTTQLILPPANNEAQAHMVQMTTNFVAPWARGHGLARLLLETVEEKALGLGFAVINLDVRRTMTRAIELYESMGYVRFGEHPYSVRTQWETIPSLYYYKVIAPEFFS